MCTSTVSFSSLPWQHAEVARVSLIFVVDSVPVGVVHLDALPNRSTQRARLGAADIFKYSKHAMSESDLTKHTVLSCNCDSQGRTQCSVPYSGKIKSISILFIYELKKVCNVAAVNTSY